MKRKKVTKLMAIALSVTFMAGSCICVSASGYNGSGYNGSGYSESSGDSKGSNSSANPAKEDFIGEVKLADGTVMTTAVPGIYHSKYFKGMAVTGAAATVNAAFGIKTGETARVTMADSQCGEKAKEVLNSALSSTGAKLVSVLDIYGFAVAKDGKVRTVEQPQGMVEFAVAIPAEMKNNIPAGHKLAIIRVYGENGVGHMDMLDNESNEPGVFQFSTDKFGVFAFVYIMDV